MSEWTKYPPNICLSVNNTIIHTCKCVCVCVCAGAHSMQSQIYLHSHSIMLKYKKHEKKIWNNNRNMSMKWANERGPKRHNTTQYNIRTRE